MKPERIQPPTRAASGGGPVMIVECRYPFASPHQALNFVNVLSEVAMDRNRYPEIGLYLSVVTVRLATRRKTDLTHLVNEASERLEGLI